jgi:hypothetical protein
MDGACVWTTLHIWHEVGRYAFLVQPFGAQDLSVTC